MTKIITQQRNNKQTSVPVLWTQCNRTTRRLVRIPSPNKCLLACRSLHTIEWRADVEIHAKYESLCALSRPYPVYTSTAHTTQHTTHEKCKEEQIEQWTERLHNSMENNVKRTITIFFSFARFNTLTATFCPVSSCVASFTLQKEPTPSVLPRRSEKERMKCMTINTTSRLNTLFYMVRMLSQLSQLFSGRSLRSSTSSTELQFTRLTVFAANFSTSTTNEIALAI